MGARRKTPQTWIEAGLRALTVTGPDGLRAETLARDLGATKGSFYWHFKDVPAFQAAVLANWSEDMRTRFETALSHGDTPVTRLRALSRVKPTPLDAAVRAWAVQDPAARKVLTQVDKMILGVISDLMTQVEATHPDFPGLVHAAMVSAPKSGSHVETLIDLLLVLK